MLAVTESLRLLLETIMPLLLVCGLPCSGKSSCVEKFISFLASHYPACSVEVLGEESLGLSRDCWFESSAREKEIRCSIRGEVERLLSPDKLVIVDSPSYVKGFRYELYCISKHARTPHCLLVSSATLERVIQWNKEREGIKFREETLREVDMRFEPPNEANRWDRPLFRLEPGHASPFGEIVQILLHGTAPKPNLSTQNTPLAHPSFLLDLEQVTSGLVGVLVEAQTGGVVLDSLRLDQSTERATFGRAVSLPELRQARRQFLSYCKLHPVHDPSQIASLFIQFLNTCFSS